MQCSRAERKAVYCSLRCRQIFCRPGNSSLRKQKAIRKVVRQQTLTVSYYSEESLVQILQHLLGEGAFESTHKARSLYPELFPPPAVQQQTERDPAPDRISAIMEEQRAWLRELFNNSKYSDIDLISVDKVYKAHRTVVCSWSPVISQSCEFNAAKVDRTGPELDKFGNSIVKASFNFGDADPQAVDCMVQFLYLWDYESRPFTPGRTFKQPGSPEENSEDSSSAGDATTPNGPLLILHSKVFTLAHMYDIPRLRDLSVEKFRAVAQSQWRSNCLLDAAREAYTATPSAVLELRMAIVTALYEHRELLDEDHVKGFLLEMPHLTLDILMHMNKSSSSLGFYRR